MMTSFCKVRGEVAKGVPLLGEKEEGGGQRKWEFENYRYTII
jgi:hypothetical protein